MRRVHCRCGSPLMERQPLFDHERNFHILVSRQRSYIGAHYNLCASCAKTENCPMRMRCRLSFFARTATDVLTVAHCTFVSLAFISTLSMLRRCMALSLVLFPTMFSSCAEGSGPGALGHAHRDIPLHSLKRVHRNAAREHDRRRRDAAAPDRMVRVSVASRQRSKWADFVLQQAATKEEDLEKQRRQEDTVSARVCH